LLASGAQCQAVGSFSKELKDQLDYIIGQQNLLKEKAELAEFAEKNPKEA